MLPAVVTVVATARNSCMKRGVLFGERERICCTNLHVCYLCGGNKTLQTASLVPTPCYDPRSRHFVCDPMVSVLVRGSEYTSIRRNPVEQ